MIVKLTYFKPETGKYYSAGEYDVPEDLAVFWIHRQVRDMLRARQLPGLVAGHGPYIVSVDVPEHANNYPVLILPEEQESEFPMFKHLQKRITTYEYDSGGHVTRTHEDVYLVD